MSDLAWTVVVPVKGAATAKSRLAPALGRWREPLAAAMTADTLDAVVTCSAVGRVVVVSGEPPDLPVTRRGVVTVVDDPTGGLDLNAAIRTGIAAAVAAGSTVVAVLTADLPALRPDELFAALAAARAVTTGIVSDTEGTGTTLLTSTAPTRLQPAFGPDSSRRHRAQGAVELAAAPWPGLQRDIDLPEHLAQARRLGLGHRTARVLERIEHVRRIEDGHRSA